MSPTLKKAFISFRIGVPLWNNDRQFDNLLALMLRHRKTAEEITFFTSETHPPLPLETVRQIVPVLRKRIVQAREAGLRAGINILSTIGHHNENLANSLSGDYQQLMDMDGKTCAGSFCPNDPHVLEYVRELYTLIASADPDHIWIDDDIRLFGHMPISETCFCDNCLKIFAGECGQSYGRKELRYAFNSGDDAAKLELRRQWLQHNADTINRLLAVIEKAVHAIKPGMELGLMSGEQLYTRYDFAGHARVLAGENGTAVRWRPGGGFYDDAQLSGMIDKAHDIGRQISRMSESVVNIQSEIENFPYQQLRKSRRAVVLETAAYIAAGCTGAAYNVLPFFATDRLEEYDPLITEIARHRDFYDLMVREGKRALPIGIHSGWNADTYITGDISGGDWPRLNSWSLAAGCAKEFWESGLPIAYGPENALVSLFSGDRIMALSDDELRHSLSGGVYMDGGALERLRERGLERYAGFRVDGWEKSDCIEENLPHQLNGGLAGRMRDGRQSFLFWGVPAAKMVPVEEGADSLARLIDYSGDEVSSCGLGIFSNALGGRVAVAGYYPWTFLQSTAKTLQLRQLMRYLSKDTLPAYIASPHKMAVWAKRPEPGRLVITVLNACLDPAEGVELMVLTAKSRITVIDMDCKEVTVESKGADGACQRFVLPSFAGWDMRLIIA